MRPSSAIQRLDLSPTFEEFNLAADRRSFIGPQVLAPRRMAAQSTNIGKTPVEQLLRLPDVNRAPGATYHRGSGEFETYSYACTEKGFAEAIDDWTSRAYGDLIDAEAVAMERSLDAVLRAFEVATAAALFNATTYTSHTSGVTNEWDDLSNATPVADVRAAKLAIENACGLTPNAMVINNRVFDNLCHCTDIMNRIGARDSQDVKVANMSTLAQIFNVDMILVGGGHKNTANEGQSVTFAPIWSDEYAWIGRVAIGEDPRENCAHRAFVWTGDGVSGPGTDQELAVVTEEYRDEDVRGTVVRCRTNWDIQTMYVEAGYLLSNITT